MAIYLGPVSVGGLGWNPVLVGMISGGAGGLIASNGNLGVGIQGAVFGGLAAAATYGIGHSGVANGPALVEDHFLRGLAHGATQGVLSEMRGGKFKDGFLSAAVGHWAGVGAGKYYGVSGWSW